MTKREYYKKWFKYATDGPKRFVELVTFFGTFAGGLAAYKWPKLEKTETILLWAIPLGLLFSQSSWPQLLPRIGFIEEERNVCKPLAKKKDIIDAVAFFLTEGEALLGRLHKDDTHQLEPAVEKWINGTISFLRTNLNEGYVARLNNFSGMTFLGDGSPKSTLRNKIDGRLRRLNEFIAELSQ